MKQMKIVAKTASEAKQIVGKSVQYTHSYTYTYLYHIHTHYKQSIQIPIPFDNASIF